MRISYFKTAKNISLFGHGERILQLRDEARQNTRLKTDNIKPLLSASENFHIANITDILKAVINLPDIDRYLYKIGLLKGE